MPESAASDEPDFIAPAKWPALAVPLTVAAPPTPNEGPGSHNPSERLQEPPTVENWSQPTRKPGRPKKVVAEADQPVEVRKFLAQWFPELFLGKRSYQWQQDVLAALNAKGSRVALSAANGSGKTSEVTAPLILWHMMRFPGSQTVVTAGVYRQVADVLWPVLRKNATGLGGEGMGWNVTEARITYCAGPGFETSLCNGFSAEQPEKAEGWHARGPSNDLLFVIDEAKGVDDRIFEAMERCQPTRVLAASSPGGRAGAFFRIFHTGDSRYKTFKVTAFDCPHITKDWIDQQITIYGEKSAFIQSMIFAEFGDDGNESLVLPPKVLQANLSSPPAKNGTEKYAGCDFAAGGDENVIVFREGNAVKEVISWRERDTMSAIGRFITEFKRFGVEADHINCDAGGLGIPMCDALREAGWDVRRCNNGESARNSDQFANRGTEMWTQYARLVETGKVIVPKDEKMHSQLTTRRLGHNSKGKLMVESKEKMRERGLASPDRADAIVLAFCAIGNAVEDYMAKHGKRVTLADLDDDMGDSGEFGHGAHAG